MHGSSMSLDGRPSIKQEPESFFVSLPRDTTSKKTNKVYPENFKEPITKQVVKHQHPNVEIGAGLRMEDEEEEMWNGPYLNDLKSGTGQNNTKNWMSELQKRNTLCLPHLKSSYPVETQFLTPNKCREDDVKFGQALDDSLKACLLPEEKQPKRNKDRTTTSYKKPGPPTPSKNGGRVSISSSDTSHVLREQYPNNTSVTQAVSRKPSTPSRIRSFFTSSRNSSALGNGAGENTEVKPIFDTENNIELTQRHKSLKSLFTIEKSLREAKKQNARRHHRSAGRGKNASFLTPFHSIVPLFTKAIYCPTPESTPSSPSSLTTSSLHPNDPQNYHPKFELHLIDNIYVWVCVSFCLFCLFSTLFAYFIHN